MRDGKSAMYKREYITKETRRTERIMLSLRTSDGLDLNAFKEDFDEDLLISKAKQLKNLKELKMIEVEDGFLKILPDFFNLSNSIIVELL